MDKQKILIDTDIGDDIDDALALALGLALPQLEIVGITTVFRDAIARARIANHLLKLAGRTDIPVYAGSGDGLVQANERLPLCQMTEDTDKACYDAVNAAAAETDNGESAVDFILEMAEKYGNELILLGIGPLTNIAKAMLKAPETMKKLKKIVIMGGTYFEHHLEWNILCDVEAADVVYSRCENLYCVGFDVTNQTTVSYLEHRTMMQMTGDPYRDYLATLVQQWSDRVWHCPTLHDPLALYYIADPEILQMKLAHIAVETQGVHTRGMTVNLDNFHEGCTGYISPGKTHIACGVDAVKMRRVLLEKLFC